VPYFTCKVVLEPIKCLGIEYAFYRINDRLEVDDVFSLQADEYLLYTNYFGVKDRYVQALVEQYRGNLIVDHAQALFAKPHAQCVQFYSPRKFVGCPDGGMAYPLNLSLSNDLPQGYSTEKCASLLQRADGDITSGYRSFHDAAEVIAQEPLTQMSRLTQSILAQIDYARVVRARRANFNYLHHHLSATNRLAPILPQNILDSVQCPMVYPYRTNDIGLREKLIDNKIFVARYWPNVLEWCGKNDLEYKLTEEILPLPIDQRYGPDEMRYIVSILKSRNYV
jgi:hypothetical protein